MRSYFSNTIKEFLSTDKETILGYLSDNHSHNLEILQRNAWLGQIEIFKNIFNNESQFYDSQIFFEFSIPRMGKRADNILLIGDSIFVIEFKVGEKNYSASAENQVFEYSLDLKNFHKGSYQKKIFPIYISTESDEIIESEITEYPDLLYSTTLSNKDNFLIKIKEIIKNHNVNTNVETDSKEWEESGYLPTPTIIEAATALYENHDVKEISRSDSGAKNLSITSKSIQEIIEISSQENNKSIIFLTGVPGSGKTLAGLNVVCNQMKNDVERTACFLSGNGPLVDVLREALTRSEIEKSKLKNNKPISRHQASIKVEAFVQKVHHFRDEYLISNNVPPEKIIVFDEAQRAWNEDMVSQFMKRNKGLSDFDKSEPEFLLEVMNRDNQWSTVICLIGGGQEINKGEGGVEEWIYALQHKHELKEWNIYLSKEIIQDNTYIKKLEMREWLTQNANERDGLHLNVSLRSFRSEKMSEFVDLLVDNKPIEAKEIYFSEDPAAEDPAAEEPKEKTFYKKYPIHITRNLNLAKRWIKEKSRGNERYGLVASSGAVRLRSLGINVKSILDPHWFLNDKTDVRSSYYLEDVATEFGIQGLELDWIIMAWDIDFYRENNNWDYKKFTGTKWNKIHKEQNKSNLLNSYRVLLTRARQGMIIYVPEGDKNDLTRKPEEYDEIYNYLLSCGIKPLNS